MFNYFVLVLWVSSIAGILAVEEGALYYKNSWIVEIPGGLETAKSVANQWGFIFINPVSKKYIFTTVVYFRQHYTF